MITNNSQQRKTNVSGRAIRQNHLISQSFTYNVSFTPWPCFELHVCTIEQENNTKRASFE